MAVTEYTSTSSASAGIFGRVVGKIYSTYDAWRTARATYTALSRLSDRELDDIGLSRGDIARISDYS